VRRTASSSRAAPFGTVSGIRGKRESEAERASCANAYVHIIHIKQTEHASTLTVWRCVLPLTEADSKARAKAAPLVLEHQLAIPVGPPLLLKPHEAYIQRWWPFSLVAAMDGSVPVQVMFSHVRFVPAMASLICSNRA
jgi:hypothetical protein